MPCNAYGMSRFSSALLVVLLTVVALSGCLGGAQPEPPTGDPTDAGMTAIDAGTQHMDASAASDAGLANDASPPPLDASGDADVLQDGSTADADLPDGEVPDGDVLDGDVPDADIVDAATSDGDVDAGFDADVDATPAS